MTGDRLAWSVLAGILCVTRMAILPVLLQTLLYSLPVLYLGAHRSFRLYEESNGKLSIRTISSSEAAFFPVISSLTLFSLFVVYKFMSAEIANLLLGGYLSFVGVGFMADLLAPPLAELLGPWNTGFSLPNLNWLKTLVGDDTTSVDLATLLGIFLGLLNALHFQFTDSFVSHNIFAIVIAIQGISITTLGCFRNVFLMLWGLFFYDIFWVFGTDVMSFVAKNVNGPVKLIFPYQFDPWKQSILGLGDLIVPGLLIAQALRYDSHLKYKKPLHVCRLGATDKIHFWWVMTCYALCISITNLMVWIYGCGQPALLYLVPGTTIGLSCVALYHQNIKELMDFDEIRYNTGDDADDTVNPEDAETSDASDYHLTFAD